ncbi:MAG: type II secretion system minor pseudopilin GspK [Burkholderiales bacterium]|jgi:general secretion pathway protein K|nr:type II secretion system minor pseudopilin GspK [Burkholderiales bacterium]
MNRPPHTPTPRRGQRGAALLMAMIIVSLVATLAVGMVWQQWQAVQVEAAERSQAQARWILNGALDWARLILREDARSGKVDHLGEPWAVPLAPARLSSFLAADRNNNSEVDAGLDAFLSGSIRDAQARYNLRNLVQQGQIQAAELQSLQRLCEILGLAPAVAGQIAEGLRRAQPGNQAEAGNSTSQRVPLPPNDVGQLTWLGLDAATVERLAPHVALLPERTPVNLNTAGREVLAAVLPKGDLGSAQRLIASRQRQHFESLEKAQSLLGEDAGTLDAQRLDVRTRYFEVVGLMQLEQLSVAQMTLLERRDRELRVLGVRRLPVDGDTLAAGPGQIARSLQQ